MSSFTRPIPSQRTVSGAWEIKQAFVYHIDTKPSQWRVRIPAGYFTGANGLKKAFKARVIHEYMYRGHYIQYWENDKKVSVHVDRKFADKTYLQAMEVLGIFFFIRFPKYWWWRCIGWKYWETIKG